MKTTRNSLEREILEGTDEKVVKSLIDKEELSDIEIEVITDQIIIPFTEFLADITFFPYQRELAKGIIQSLLKGDGARISALFARQSGKTFTTGKVTAGTGIILPVLAQHFKAKNFQKFRTKFLVGIFGPSYDKSALIYNQIRDVFETKRAQKILRDPEIGIDIKSVKNLKFPNGFQVALRTADKKANIEGDSYMLILTDETQLVDSYVIRKSILPMRNFYAGTVVHLGTPIPEACEFSEVCYRNQALDSTNKYDAQRHYQFDYTYVSECNPNYKKIIEEDVQYMGEDSDEFRLNYKLEWIDTKGKLMTKAELDGCGVIQRDELKQTYYKAGREIETTFVRPHGLVSSDIYTEDQIFSIDYGKDANSTVVTVARVWWDNPVEVGRERRYYVHVHDWLELKGDDHEVQLEEIIKFLGRFKVLCGINDATGKGDPLHTRLRNLLMPMGIDLYPFIYSLQSKHAGYTLFKQEIYAQRFTYPDSDKVRTYGKHKAFKKQLVDLVKEYSDNNYMKIRKPNMKQARDDYADSAMQLTWLANMVGRNRIKIIDDARFSHYKTRSDSERQKGSRRNILTDRSRFRR